MPEKRTTNSASAPGPAPERAALKKALSQEGTARRDRRRRVAVLMRHGLHGQRLALHRALARRRLPKNWVLLTFAIPLLVSVTLLLFVPSILLIWHDWIGKLIGVLGVPGTLSLSSHVGGVQAPFKVSWLDARIGAPTTLQWWVGFSMTAVSSLVSFFLPNRWLPVAYMLRLLSIVMAVSLAYFLFSPASFPYSTADHVGALLIGWLLLAAFTPLVFGLTYNVLDFSMRSRYLLLAITVGFLLLVAPLWVMVHVVLLAKGSLLYQPLLFLFGGLFPGLTVMIAFYSWAMTWERDRQRASIL